MTNSNACPLENPPKIEFPCAYPIKVMGEAAPDFKACILDVLQQAETTYEETSISVVDSKNGRFQSVRVTIEAQSYNHLEELHACLKATGRVNLVL